MQARQGKVNLTVFTFRNRQRPMTPIVRLNSAITCPDCGFVREEIMPTDACQFFYRCTNCHALLRPKPDDCCVFCAYGSVKCPPIQLQAPCCGASSRILRDRTKAAELG